jgi:hypothetical protein
VQQKHRSLSRQIAIQLFRPRMVAIFTVLEGKNKAGIEQHNPWWHD